MFVIKNSAGEIMRIADGRLMIFEYVIQARKMIERRFGSSPNLTINRWNKKKKKYVKHEEK